VTRPTPRPESNLVHPPRWELERRTFLSSVSLAAAAATVVPRRAWAGCDLTPSDILGPFYAEDPPFRTVLCDAKEIGTRLFISGRIFARDCVTPLEGAVVDVWQANDAGCYSIFQGCADDDDPYNLRGQMLTNAAGEYAFETIVPGYYTGRPLHIHFIVAAASGESLTSQLYFEFDPQSAGVPADLRIPLDEVDGQLFGTWDVTLDVDATVATDDAHSTPTVMRLHPNYPNPFRAGTTIRYQLRLDAPVTLEVFTADGRLVRRLVNERRQGPGYYTVSWEGRDERGRPVAPGTYLYRLQAGPLREVRKMARVR